MTASGQPPETASFFTRGLPKYTADIPLLTGLCNMHPLRPCSLAPLVRDSFPSDTTAHRRKPPHRSAFLVQTRRSRSTGDHVARRSCWPATLPIPSAASNTVYNNNPPSRTAVAFGPSAAGIFTSKRLKPASSRSQRLSCEVPKDPHVW